MDLAVDPLSRRPSTELALLLVLAIFTGFVTAHIFTANFNSATNASRGVIYVKKNNENVNKIKYIAKQ